MNGRVIHSGMMDVNDTTKFTRFDIAPWQRLAVQMMDPEGAIGSAVFEFERGIDGQTFNGYSTAVEFTSTTSTQYQRDINVEHATHGQLRLTTAKGSAGTVWFTVYGYNVED